MATTVRKCYTSTTAYANNENNEKNNNIDNNNSNKKRNNNNVGKLNKKNIQMKQKIKYKKLQGNGKKYTKINKNKAKKLNDQRNIMSK